MDTFLHTFLNGSLTHKPSRDYKLKGIQWRFKGGREQKYSFSEGTKILELLISNFF